VRGSQDVAYPPDDTTSATENGDFGAVLTLSQTRHTARGLAVYASPSSYLLRRNTRFRVALGLARTGFEPAGLQKEFLYLFMGLSLLPGFSWRSSR